METITSFKQLMVYQLAFSLALEVHKLSLAFPKIEQFVLADQLRRASRSVFANIAEGYGKKILSIPEFRRFLGMAFASAEEVGVWLDFAFALGYLQPNDFNRLSAEYLRVSKMLRSLISKWK